MGNGRGSGKGSNSMESKGVKYSNSGSSNRSGGKRGVNAAKALMEQGKWQQQCWQWSKGSGISNGSDGAREVAAAMAVMAAMAAWQQQWWQQQ